MTSTPVKNVGFGLGVAAQAGTGTMVLPKTGFQTVWDSQAGKQADSAKQPQDSQVQDGQTVKKAPGDSLKARDEHRARTEKREPSRDVEERTDIPEEKLEEAAEALGAAAVQVMQEVAETFGTEPARVQEVMAGLGLEAQDILTPKGLESLVLGMAGEESPQAFLTDEGLYGSYQELMDKLDMALQECGGALGMSPEQLVQAAWQPEISEQQSREPLQQPQEPVQQPVLEVTVQEPARNEPLPEDGFREAGDEKETQEPVQKDAVSQPPADGKDVEREQGHEDGGEKHSRSKDRQEGGREQGITSFAHTVRTEQFTSQVQQSYALSACFPAWLSQTSKEVQEYAAAYSAMKPKAAAEIFNGMTDQLDLVAKILNAMSTDARGDILAAMDAEIAGRLTKIMDPDS